MARRIPKNGKDLPATWQLGVALVWGFLLFNQVLFALMEFLTIGRGEPDTFGKFALASKIVGVVVLLCNLSLFAIAKPKRLTDWQALLISAAVSFLVWGRLGEMLRNPVDISFALFNSLICLWLARGLILGGGSKKFQKS